MNTIERPEAPGQGAREPTSGSGARPDKADAVLLLVTILTLMGIAAGIAIGFPLALEAASAHAYAARVASPAPPPLAARPLHEHQKDRGHRVARGAAPGVASPETGAPAPPLAARPLHEDQKEEIEEYDDPLIVDDVRSEERMYAGAGIAGSVDGSAPATSANNAPGTLIAMKDRRRDAGEHEGIPSF